MKVAFFTEKYNLYPKILSYLLKFNKYFQELNCIVFRYYFTDEQIQNLKYLKFDKLIILTNLLLMKYDYEAFSQALYEYAKKYKPDLLIIGDTLKGREVASRLSAKLNIPALTGVEEIIDIKEKSIIVNKYTHKGVYLTTYEISIPAILSLNVYDVTNFENIKSESATNEEENVIAINVSRVIVRDIIKLETRYEQIKNSKILIGIGEDIKNEKDLKQIEEVAKLLNATLTCSRFIATRRRWFNEWIGVSYIKAKPLLYLSFGIKGAPEHLAGIIEAKKIIAVNSDPSSPIFEVSDYYLVGDNSKIILKLLKKLKQSYSL